MSIRGQDPLSYLGVFAPTPPNIKQYDRAPTTDDKYNFIVGDLWIDKSVSPINVYMLVSLASSTAIWLEITSKFGAVGTDGQILVGKTGLDPVFTDLTSSGSTITITGGAGTLNIDTAGTVPVQFDGDTGSAVPALGVLTIAGGTGVATTGAGSTVTVAVSCGGMTWTDVTGTSQAMVADNAYMANNAAQVTLTLPATAAQFTYLEVLGQGAGGWKIAQNAGQDIIWNGTYSTTAGVGGYLESTDDYDRVRLVCTVANTTWTVGSSKGNITVA